MISAIQALLSGSILKTVKGLVAGLFIGHGMVKGFDWQHTAIIVAMFVIHHWPEIVSEAKKVKADASSGDVDAIAKDVDELRDKVSALMVGASFKRQTGQPDAARGV